MHLLPIRLKLNKQIYRLIMQMLKKNNNLKNNKKMKIYFNINLIDSSALKIMKEYLIKHFNK